MNVLPTEHIAPNYLARFRCIGADCEESCCSGWSVPVDAHHYQKLQQRMSGSPGERGEFTRQFHRVEDHERETNKYALAVLTDASDCSFLDTDRLCSIQKRYGSDFLPDTCALYPRQVGLVGTRVELTAKVSCPEIARKLLLDSDAMKLAPVQPSALERGAVNRTLPNGPHELYDRGLDVLRSAILDMLGDRRYPFASRLAFVACMADSLTPHFHRGAPAANEEPFLRVVRRARSDDMRALIHREFAALEVPGEFAKTIVVRVLRSRRAGGGSLGKLVEAMFARFRSGPAEGRTRADDEELVHLLAAYGDSKKRCESAFGARLDGYFANYAMNYFLQEWYTAAPNLAVHTQNLVLRTAILRFLLLCHPAVAVADLDPATLDRAAVEVFYKFARGVEHNEPFLGSVEKHFQTTASDLAHAMFLAKF
jgi:lysine-N-methylase